MARGRKRGENSLYFTESTQNAIVEYVNSTNQAHRDKIFQDNIYFPFLKIAEVWYNKLNIPYIKEESLDAQYDCMSHMVEKLGKFRQDKGKAFSYFSVMARNYYIQLNLKEYKKISKYELQPLQEDFDSVDTSYGRLEEVILYEEILIKFTEWIEEHYEKIFKTNRERQIGKVIVNQMKDIDNLEDFNRNNLLNKIAEIVEENNDTRGSVRGYVTRVLNVLTAHYNDFKDEYLESEKVIGFRNNKIPKSKERWVLENYQPYHETFGAAPMAKKLKVKATLIRNFVSQNLKETT